MTTKRILLIFGGVVVTVGLLVMVFVGGIVGFAIYQVKQRSCRGGETVSSQQ